MPQIILALLILLLATAPALADPISIALLTAVGIEATAGVVAITTAVLGVATSVGLSLIASALRSKTDPQAPDTTDTASGSDLNTQYGGDVPRTALLGLAATGGQLVYANVGPPDNKEMQAVFVLGDSQHDGISRIWYNGKLITVPAGPVGTLLQIPEFMSPDGVNSYLRLKFFDGRYDQEADPDLVAQANPAGRWTSNHRGRGVCYLVVSQTYNEEHSLTGMPSVLVEMRGLKLYDPRFDSTVGGSGAQRWGQPATYAWSDNPAIIEYNYRRGIYVNNQLILGMGVSPADLILSMYVAAANVCDEAVALLEGGSEKRYRCGFTAKADSSHSEAITTVRDAMAGYSLERIGQFAPIPGVNQITLFTFTDDDLEVGKSFAFSKYKTRSAVATAIFGTFSDPEQLWGSVPFPPRIDDADDALMGERLSRSVDLSQVYSHSQAQRIAEIERRRSMLQTNGACTLPARFFGIQPGDWGTYQSERYGTFGIVVKGATINEDHSITLTWDRIEAHCFSWTTAGEEDRPAIPIGGVPGTRTNIVTGFSAIGIDVPGDGGVMHAGFQIAWDPITDPTVINLIIEFRVAATGGDWEEILFTNVNLGFGQLSRGIQGNTVYELRASLLVSPFRPTGITGPISALSGNHIVQSAFSADSVLAEDIIGQLVTDQLHDAAVTAAKLHEEAVTATSFAAGIEPVALVSALPPAAGYTGPRTVFNTTDHNLYTYNATTVAWEASAGASDFSELTGHVVEDQIAFAAVTADKLHTEAVTATKFAADIEPVALVTTLPTAAGYTGPRTVFNTTDHNLYTYNAGTVAWEASAGASDFSELTGHVVEDQIAFAAVTADKLHTEAVTAAKFAADIEPVAIVSSLPSPSGYTGPKSVFNTSDRKSYRYTGTAFIATIPTTDLTGQIATAQIEAGAVTNDQIADMAAAKLTGQITGTQIKDDAVTTPKIFAGSVTTAKVAAGAITTLKLAVGVSSNKILNSDGASGIFPGGWASSFASPSRGIYSSIPGIQATYLLGTATDLSEVHYQLMQNPDLSGVPQMIPVVAGQAYEFSFYVSTLNSNCFALIQWYDNAGTLLTSAGSPSTPAGGGGNDLANWSRPWVVGVAPAGAVSALLYCYFVPIALGDVLSYIACPYFAPASPNQTEPSPWSPAGVTVIQGGQVVTQSITATQILANTITAAQIATHTITAGQIAATTITAAQIAGGAISTTQLAGGAVTANTIAAGAITTAKLAVGYAANKIINSDGTSGPFSNDFGSNLGGSAGVNYFQPGVISKSFGVTQASGTATGANESMQFIFRNPDLNGSKPNISIVAGQMYEFSCYVSVTNVDVYAFIAWFDNSGNLITQPAGDGIASSGGGGDITNWARPYILAVAPAGATSAAPFLYFLSHGAGDVAGYMAAPYFGAGSPNQTDLSPWSPAGVTVIQGGQIVTHSITATQILANTITAAQIAGGTITAGQIAATTITAGQIAGGAISTDQLAGGAVTARTIAAGAITADKLAVGNGSGNCIPNSDLLAGLTPNVQLGYGTVGYAPAAFGWNPDWAPKGMNCVYVQFGGSPSAGTVQDISFFRMALAGGGGAELYPVQGGKRYEFSCYLSMHRCSGAAHICWYDVNGTQLDESIGNSVFHNGVSGGTADFEAVGARSVCFAVAPSWAAFMRPVARATYDGTNDPYMFVSGLFFAQASPYQTEPSPWAPAGVTVITGGQIVASSITAAQITANTITAAQIAGGTITAAQIAGGTITAGQIAATTITAGQIAGGAISTTQLAAGAVKTGILAAGAVTASKIAVGGGTQQDLIINGGFEEATHGGPAVGWGPYGDSDSQAHSGLRHNGNFGMYCLRGPAGYMGISGNYIPCLESTVYEASVWLWPLDAVSGPSVNVFQSWFDINHTFLGSTNIVAPLPGGWSKAVGQVTSPAGAAFVIPYCFSNPGDGSTNQLVIDDYSLRRAAGTTMIEDGSITTNKIVAQAVTATQIAGGTITGDRIAGNTISAGNIVSNTITAGQIAGGAISTGQLAALAVTTGILASGAVTSDILASGSVIAGKIATDAIVAGNITARNVVAGHLQAGAIDVTSVIADNIIVAGKMILDNMTKVSATQGSVSFNLGGATINLIDINISTSGYKLVVSAAIDLNQVMVFSHFLFNASAAGMTLHLLRDGGVVGTSWIPCMYNGIDFIHADFNSVQWVGHFEVTVVDQPGAGGHNYTLQIDTPAFLTGSTVNAVATISTIEALRTS